MLLNDKISRKKSLVKYVIQFAVLQHYAGKFAKKCVNGTSHMSNSMIKKINEPYF